MKSFLKLLNQKFSKRTFYIALAVMVLQIGLSHHAIMKPISLKSDLTLMYTLIIGSLVAFPITLSVILSYLLDRIKWLNKEAFIKSFLISAAVLILFTILNVLEIEIPFFEDFIRFTYRDLGIFMIPGVPLGLLMYFILGWTGSFAALIWLMYFTGIFAFSAIFATLYARIALISKKKKKPKYKTIFITVVLVLFTALIIKNVHKTYVYLLTQNDQCAYGLNAFQCKDYKQLKGHYFTYKDNVYYNELTNKLEGETASDFTVLDESYESFAVGNKVYYDGKALPGADVESWSIIDDSEYPYNDNRHSKDNEQMYYMFDPLEGADPKTTAVFDRDYACNKEKVYISGDVLEGADPLTFVTLDCGGYTKDKDGYFLYGERVSDKTAALCREHIYQIVSTCQEALDNNN